MFETIGEWEDSLKLLELEAVFVEHGEPKKGYELKNEEYWNTVYTEFSEIANDFVYKEEYDSTIYFFRFPQLHEFYTLCKLLCRKEGVNFRKSVYATEAENFVRQTLLSLNGYCFGWNLWVPKKLVKKRAYTFLVEIGCEFYDYLEMIDAVLTVREYYTEKCEELRKLLGKPKTVKMKNGKERKAA